MMETKKLTIASVVKEVKQQKPVNVRQMKQLIDVKHPDNNFSEKDLKGYLYGEYYGEDYEKDMRIKNFY